MHSGFKPKLKICHMYPELLNLYGDHGNVIAFSKRCQWRGIEVTIYPAGIGDPVDFTDVDFVFLGGGSDREQKLMAPDLMKKKEAFRDAVEDGLVVLAICGGYQLMGKYYRTHEGKVIPGLDILDFYTVGGQKRLIGNVAVEIELDGEKKRITGFENHSGHTFLGDIEPLGTVLSGYGNNMGDKMEGVRYKNVVGSYLHGPLLPKNPFITDYLIAHALERNYSGFKLEPLDDTLEVAANEVMLKRLLG